MISSFAGRSISGDHSRWSILLLCAYGVYLLTALTVPIVGKLAAGFLLSMGILGLFRLKSHYRALSVIEGWLLVSFALFSLVSVASFFYWPQSRESRMHLEDYATFMLLVPLFLLLRQFRLDIGWLMLVMALAAIFFGVVSIIQVQFLGIPRSGGAVNPMRYGGVSLVLASISLNSLLFIGQKKMVFNVFFALAACLGLVACFLTQVRGVWLAIPFLILAYGVCLYRDISCRFLVGLLVGVVALAVMANQSNLIKERVQTTILNIERYQQGDAQTSIGARLDMFRVAGMLIKEEPIWGYGLNSYSLKASEIRVNSPGMSDQVGVWANPHNEILQVMVEKGLIGLLTLLLLFGVPGRMFFKALFGADNSRSGRQVKFYGMSGLSILIVYAVAGQSVALFEHDVFNHFFALMVLLFASQVSVIEYVEGRFYLR